jgi:glutathione S-transferase
MTIARFIAKRFKLSGDNELDEAKADAIVDTIVDTLNAYVQKVFMAKSEEEKTEARKKFLAEDAVTHLGKIEKLIGLYGSNGFSVGSSLKWSDLAIYDISSTMHQYDEKVLDAFSHIQAVRASVLANEKVAEYLKNRPKTDF